MDPAIEAQVDGEIRRSFAIGGIVAASLGLVGGTGLLITAAATGDAYYYAPAPFALFAGATSLVLRALVLRGRMHGFAKYAAGLAFASLPTLFFVFGGSLFDSGTATFINGAILNLYAFVLVTLGFLFDARLVVTASFVVAAEYLAVFAGAHRHLAKLQAPYPELLQDIQAPAVAANRAMIIAATGLAVAGLCVIARRLLRNGIQQEREKAEIRRTFGQYVSDEVSEAILRSEAASRGQSKEVVILFSDLRGFSTFSEGRPPEEIVARLNAYFDRMVAAISAEGGVVDKFIGDAVMAVFGGVVDAENPSAAAVRASLGMRRALAELNAEWAREGIEPFESGIGIHRGDVVLGPIGSETRKEFTVIGDAVNTASRLESLTKDRGHPILVTRSVHEALPDSLRQGFTPLAPAHVKGKREELQVYGAGTP